MLACDHCRSLLWDELYGLLEASQSQTLRRHLTDCIDCRAEMDRAEAGQRLIASVARLNLEIPLFTLPERERAAAVAGAGDRQRLHLTRGFSMRPWLAAAAAILVCVGLSYGTYRHGLNQRALAVEHARNQVAQIAAREQDLVKKADSAFQARQAAARAQYTRLQVLGPATYQPGLLSRYRVLATDLDGQPRLIDLTARLSDDKHVLFENKISGKGELSVALPAGLPALPRTQARLEFITNDASEPLHFQETVDVLEPHYVTQLITDKALYHPGETIYFRSLTLEPFALKPVDREFNVSYTLMDPRSARIERLAGQTRRNGAGGGTFALKADASPGQYRLTVTDLANRFWPVTRTIRVAPVAGNVNAPLQAAQSVPRIDFFPEGGNLVAGVPNRVYFRAEKGEGSPVDLAGKVVDSRGNEVAAVKTLSLRGNDFETRGLGVFTFTPAAGESYTLRVTNPPGASAATLPAAQAEGVVLSAPASVLKEGEEIPLILHSAASERHLVVAATCRGGLVAEGAVTIKSGATELRLRPALGTRGVLRVTVFDSRKEKLQPIAQRLIYCAPTEPLNLDAQTTKKTYRPGERVTLTIQQSDEKRRPEQTWLSVSTGKRDALSQADGPPEQNLPQHLHFASSLGQPEGIEQALFVVRNDPQEGTALDLFLGTRGWRRITPAFGAAAGQEVNPVKGDAESAAVAMFALDNIGQVEKSYLSKGQDDYAKAEAALTLQLRGLGADRALQEAADAARQLSAYEARMRGYARMALGLLATGTLMVACTFLIVALVGLVRGSLVVRRRLTTAFAGGIVCLLCLPLSNWLTADSTSTTSDSDLARNLPRLSYQMARDLHQDKFLRTESTSPVKITNIAAGGPGSRPVNVPAGPPLRLAEYAYIQAHQPVGAQQAPETLLWKPDLALEGKIQVSFDLPKEPALYRVHVEGRTRSGRFGVVDLLIDTRRDAD